MKQQFIYINGGVPKENFENYYDMLHTLEYNPYEEKFLSWNKTLWEKLWDDWEYFRVPFHDRDFADYTAWKIMFEKMIPFFNEEIYVWAGSLWGTFILKYMGENDGIRDSVTWKHISIKKLFFLAAATDDTPDEKLWSFSFDIDMCYNKVQRWAEQVYIYHSRDDMIVPIEQSLKLKSYFPTAVYREFDDKGHFYLEAELPELLEDLKNSDKLEDS